ncbi:MAG: hypothetical protein ACPG4Q_12260 [Phycisphaeraceae bacterium]
MLDWLIDWLWLHTWWSYAGSEDPLHANIYRGINIVEGLFWVGFTIAVLRRHFKQTAEKRGSIEWPYAAAFLCFAITDFREAVALQSWLIGLKLVNLIVLLWLRHRVMKTLYPKAKLY